MARDPEPTVQTVGEFEARVRGMSLEDFARTYPHPFLLEWRPRATDEPFRGSRTATPGMQNPAIAAPPATARVVQVRKTPAGQAFRHVTVGRTPNNDIPLGESCISKLHAYFMSPVAGEAGARWQLVDVSTYGTAVNGERCKAERPVPLLRAATEAAAPRISFADIHFQFLEEPQMLLAALASLLQRG
jgi:hypothetical protein